MEKFIKGDIVKIARNKESFWCIVEHVHESGLTLDVKVDNELICQPDGVTLGSVLSIGSGDIIEKYAA